MTFVERAATAAEARARIVVLILGALGVVALAVLSAWRPQYGLVASGALLVGLFLLLVGRRLPQLFLALLALALAGYAFLGRGIAYLGVSPIYMGEMVLALGLVALLFNLPRLRLGLVQVVLLLFMAWGAARTIPYISVYGIDALRDGVLWGYGAFAIVISVCLRPPHIRKLVALYGRVMPYFLLWVPVAAFLYLGLATYLPRLPGSPTAILDFKGGDMSVHLAGAAAFLLVGLYGDVRRNVSDLLLWTGWLIGIAVSAIINRGGMLAAAAGAAVAALFMPAFSRFVKPAAAGTAIILVLLIVNPQLELSKGRTLSVTQLIDNFSSVVDSSSVSGLQGTIQWREAWWGTIVNYTFNGPYFWAGKGYGINLATADGFQLDPTGQSLRAPHNGHLDILARSGVVGFGLWLAFLATFALGMIRAAILARRRGDTFWVQVTGWILAYWIASTVNATFDVYLEGPQGGIWFWALTGIGLVVMHAAARGEPAEEVVEERRPVARPLAQPGPA